MLPGARQFFEKRGAPAWTNPYVTDGLVAMWDGEWNAGGGVHDPNTAVWKDLVGTNDLHLTASSSFGENYFLSTAGAESVGDPRIPVATAEAVIDTTGTRGWFVICYYRQVVGNMRWIGMRANDTVNFGNSADCMQGQRNGRNYYAGAYDIYTQSISLYMNGLQMPNLGPGMGGIGENYLRIPGTNPPFTCYAIRFYSRALTAAEIAANYAIDKARFNLP